MSRGPLGFPRLTDIGPLVDSLSPTIDLEPGEYNMSVLEQHQGKTAHDTAVFIQEVLRAHSPEAAMFKYGKVSISDIVVEDGFIPTLAKYVGESPGEVEAGVMDERIPKRDIAAISSGFPEHMGRSDAARKFTHDVQRVNSIHDEIEASGEYWPPTYEKGLSTLDGAHRVAALYHFTGMRNMIYGWELLNADEIGVE